MWYNDDESLRQIQNALKNTFIMLNRRGFHLNDEHLELLQMDCRDLLDYIKFHDELVIAAHRQPKVTLQSGDSHIFQTPDLISVFVCLAPKLGVQNLRQYKTQCVTTKDSPKNHYLVLTTEITPFAHSYISEQNKIGEVDIEVFTYKEKQLDIVSHKIVPPHLILSQHQKQELYKRLHVANDSQMPQRLIKDPIARYYHLPAGTVTEMRHTTGAMERFSYYRVVSSAN